MSWFSRSTSVAEKTFAERRKEAEERSSALLRAIVPEEDWRYHQGRSSNGRLAERKPTHLEFLSQSGAVCQIWFNATSENIRIISGPRAGRGLCGGPHAYADYVLPGQARTYVVNQQCWDEARQEAYRQNTQPLTLPASDIWLGQYLALKYDEAEFLSHANMF